MKALKLVAALFAMTMAAPAVAENTPTIACPSGGYGAACTAAYMASQEVRTHVAQAESSVPMACVRYVSYEDTELLWMPADRHTYVNADPLARQIPGNVVDRFSLNPEWVVIESCVPQAWIADLSVLTHCNGANMGDGYHWQVSGQTLERLQGNMGHPGTYLPLLSEADRERFTPAQVEAAYRARYN